MVIYNGQKMREGWRGRRLGTVNPLRLSVSPATRQLRPSLSGPELARRMSRTSQRLRFKARRRLTSGLHIASFQLGSGRAGFGLDWTT